MTSNFPPGRSFPIDEDFIVESNDPEDFIYELYSDLTAEDTEAYETA